MAGEDEEGSLCPFEAASEQKVLVGTSRDALGSPRLIYMGAGSMGGELLRQSSQVAAAPHINGFYGFYGLSNYSLVPSRKREQESRGCHTKVVCVLVEVRQPEFWGFAVYPVLGLLEAIVCGLDPAAVGLHRWPWCGSVGQEEAGAGKAGWFVPMGLAWPRRGQSRRCHRLVQVGAQQNCSAVHPALPVTSYSQGH